MSLNPTEQRVFDHLEQHPEEKRHWNAKVAAVALSGDRHEVATRLERDLWGYFEERSRSERTFRQLAATQGVQRISMRNLAEHLLRLWAPPPPRRQPPTDVQI